MLIPLYNNSNAFYFSFNPTNLIPKANIAGTKFSLTNNDLFNAYYPYSTLPSW